MPYLSLSLAVAAAACLPWTSFASANPRALGMDFHKVKAPRTIMRRDSGVSVTLTNLKKLYLLDLEIGTPPQLFRVNLDTGSSDLFVPSITEDFCLLHQGDCQKTGAYEALKSSTQENTHLPFYAGFGDGSTYNGTFYKDTVRLGGATMEKVQFGVAETTTSLTTGSKGADVAGLMGVGFDTSEAGVAQGEPLYPNIISELQRNSVIGTKAFSLYINSQDAATGNVLFGGVDASLYTGPLIPVPMIKQAGGPAVTDYYVSWTSFTSSSASGDSKNDLQDLSNNTLPAAVLLDSGSESSTLPPDMYSSLQQFFGAGSGSSVSCSQANNTATFQFGFGGPTGAKIVTPAGAFVRPYDPANPAQGCDEPPCCELSGTPDGLGGCVLGDDFLHSAYLVFDLDNKVIALAQSNLSPSGGSSIREIQSGLHGIPGAIYGGAGNASGNSTAAGTAGSTASGGVASATGGVGGNGLATGTHPPIASSTGAADRTRGLGMGVVMLGAAVGFGGLI